MGVFRLERFLITSAALLVAVAAEFCRARTASFAYFCGIELGLSISPNFWKGDEIVLVLGI